MLSKWGLVRLSTTSDYLCVDRNLFLHPRGEVKELITIDLMEVPMGDLVMKGL